jgi:hypothetical protein
MAYPKTHSSVSVQLIRNTDNMSDDLITLRQAPDGDLLSLTYKDRISNSQHTLRLTKTQAAEYIISLCHILSYDTEPFKGVQVNFPAFPCVMLSPNDLAYESLRERIHSMLWFTMENSFVAMNEVATY